MKLKNLNINCGREPMVFLNASSSIIEKEGFIALNRVAISDGNETVYATLSILEDNPLKDDELGLSKSVFNKIKNHNGDFEMKHMDEPASFTYVRKKLRGVPFTEESIFEVIKDIVDGKYTDMHMACVCSATEGENLSDDEIAYLAKAMTGTGETIDWGNKDIIVDKHCIGGIPGNRTTIIAIPIVAEFGLTIPKTSSSAITSASGTAEVMNVFTEVDIKTEDMKKIVEDVNGCVVWGGGVDLNPSDDIIIKVKKDLNLDSRGQMLASIISKKVAAGSNCILIDVPYGKTAKTKTYETARSLKNDFENLGKKLGVNIFVNISDGSQPVGRGVGPALEAQDVLNVLENKAEGLEDLKEKAIKLSGIILEFSPDVKKGEGAKIAREILESGRALKRFKMICEAQGGLKEIPVAKYTHDILADKDGILVEIDNKAFAGIAKLAGSPLKPAAGVYLHKHLNEQIKKGDKLYTIHSESEGELEVAIKAAENSEIFIIK